MLAKLRRLAEINLAFLTMGFRTALAYPANLITSQLQPLLQVVIFYFVAQLVTQSGPSVGGDYFTFVVIGWMAILLLQSGLGAFSIELQQAVQQGRFEMLLVEPVRWTLLPFGLALWPLVQKSIAMLVLVLLALLLGAQFELRNALAAVLVLGLGVLATVSVGTLSGSMIVLAKRGDPLVKIYQFSATVFSGALFPIELLPTWLRPLSHIVPHTHVINALRKLLMPRGHILPGPSFSEACVHLIAFTAIVLPISIWVFGRVMRIGQRLGTLSGY